MNNAMRILFHAPLRGASQGVYFVLWRGETAPQHKINPLRSAVGAEESATFARSVK